MKKYIFWAITVVVVTGGIGIAYAIVAPSRAAARDLEAINGLTVGQTTEAELLARAPFQKADYQCSENFCVYAYRQENRILSLLHLAPYTAVTSSVVVSNGVVVQIFVFILRQGQTPIVVKQMEKLPRECSTNPCAGKPKLPAAAKSIRLGTTIMFSRESDYRNRIPQMIHMACLSHIGGCASDAEVVPISKALETKEVTY